jgi:hypothetical protein
VGRRFLWNIGIYIYYTTSTWIHTPKTVTIRRKLIIFFNATASPPPFGQPKPNVRCTTEVADICFIFMGHGVKGGRHGSTRHMLESARIAIVSGLFLKEQEWS